MNSRTSFRRKEPGQTGIISVCIEGTNELRLELSDDNEWILIDEIPISNGINRRDNEQRSIGTHTA